MDSDRSEQLGQGSIPGLLLRFSAPAIVGTLAQALYNVIDTIFVGRAIGIDGIAGTTVALPPMVIVLAFGMLVGFGAAALISIRLGERNKAEAEHILGNAAVLLVVISLAITRCGPAFSRRYSRAVRGQRKDSAAGPGLFANHFLGDDIPDRSVWAECRDPRRGQPADRHALDADQRVAERRSWRRSLSFGLVGGCKGPRWPRSFRKPFRPFGWSPISSAARAC